jgi:hypothetical protein
LSHVYDRTVTNRWFERPRRSELELARIQATGRMFVVGIGAGFDLPYLPQDATVFGIDLSPAGTTNAPASGVAGNTRASSDYPANLFSLNIHLHGGSGERP